MNWLGSVILTGISAFLGALAAFLFASYREKRRQEDNQYAALRLAYLAVISHYQKFISLWDSCLRDHEGNTDAWQQLPPVKGVFNAPALHVAELVFAFESSDPDLLNRLVVGGGEIPDDPRHHRYEKQCTP